MTVPKTVRVTSWTPPKFRDSESLFRCFHDNMRNAMNGNTLGIFASPPQSFYLFFPSKQRTTLPPSDHDGKTPTSNTNKIFSAQLIVVGKMPSPPIQKLGSKVCFDHLLGKYSKSTFGKDRCAYPHSLFPRDFDRADRLVMDQWVKDNDNLKWRAGAQAALDRLKLN